MRPFQRQDVRSTLALDDDVAAKLRVESRRSGQSFKQLVIRYLPPGLLSRRPPRRQRFAVKARPLDLRKGLNYHNGGELLEQLEAAGHR